MSSQRIDLATELASNKQNLSTIFTHDILNLLIYLSTQAQNPADEKEKLQRGFRAWWEDPQRTDDQKFELLNDPKLNPFVNLTVKKGADTEDPVAEDHHTTIFDIINPTMKDETQRFRGLPNVQKSVLKKSMGEIVDEVTRLWDQPGKAQKAHIGRNKHLGYALVVAYKGMLQPTDYNAEQIVTYGQKLTGRAQDSQFYKRLGNLVIGFGFVLAFTLLVSSLILSAAIPPTLAAATFMTMFVLIGAAIVAGVEAAGIFLRLFGRERSMAKHTQKVGNDLFRTLHPLEPKTLKQNFKVRFLHFFGIKSKQAQQGYQPVENPVPNVDFFGKGG